MSEEKDTFKFQRSFEGNSVIPEAVGRIYLGDGNIIRLIFTIDGVVALVPDCKNVKIYKPNEGFVEGFNFNERK